MEESPLVGELMGFHVGIRAKVAVSSEASQASCFDISFGSYPVPLFLVATTLSSERTESLA